MYVCMCVYGQMFVRIFICLCVYIFACMCVWMCAYLYVYVYMCADAYLYVYVYMCVCGGWAPHPCSLSVLGQHSQAVLPLCCLLWFLSLQFWTLPDGRGYLPTLRKSCWVGVGDSCMCQQDNTTRNKTGPLWCFLFLVFKVPPFHQTPNLTLPHDSYI